MSGNKTIPNKNSVADFINSLETEAKKADSLQLLAMMKKATGEEPIMWGPSIVGFGQYHYKYESGREGEMMLTGFSPRKRSFSLYVGAGSDRLKPLLKKLGKHSTGKSCLYIKNLNDVNTDVLQEIIKNSYEHYKAKHK